MSATCRKRKWWIEAGRFRCGHWRTPDNMHGGRDCKRCGNKRAKAYRKARCRLAKRKRLHALAPMPDPRPIVATAPEQYILPCVRRGPAPRIQPPKATLEVIESCREQLEIFSKRLVRLEVRYHTTPSRGCPSDLLPEGT